MLLTDTLRRLDGRTWNSLGRLETVLTIISGDVLDISWTFHENLFFGFSITLITKRIQEIEKATLDSRGQPQHPQNVTNLCLSHVRSLLKISWKSVPPCSRNIANRHGFPWKYSKRNLVHKALNVTLPKFSILVLVSWPTYPEYFTKIRSPVFPQRCPQTHKHTYRQTNRDVNITFAVRRR